MKKYYIEVVWHGSCDGYMLQSKWFDTEEQALEWAYNIDYVVEYIDVYLMSSVWDVEKDIYEDIVVERQVK